MEKSKLQSNRKSDKFKIANFKLFDIVASECQDIQTKVDNDSSEKNAENCVLQLATNALESTTTYNNTVTESQLSSLRSKSFDINSALGNFYIKDITNSFGSNEFYNKINALYCLHNRRATELEENCKIILNQLQDQYHKIASNDIVSERISALKNTTTHLQKIITEVSLLKQKLRTPVFLDVWNIQIHYHKFIVQFFETSKMLIMELEKNTETYQWITNQNAHITKNLDPYLAQLCSTIIQFEKFLGSLFEFRRIFTQFNHPKNSIEILVNEIKM